MTDLLGQPFLFRRPRLASGYAHALMGLTPSAMFARAHERRYGPNLGKVTQHPAEPPPRR